MPIRCEHAQPVRATPAQAFAMIDDLSSYARWLPPCVSLTKVGSGPNAVGDQLRYVYREGSRQREMAGEIVARVPGERLHTRYTDAAFVVDVDLRISGAPEGALCTHIVEITPKSIMGRLFSPLIKLGLNKQTRDAATNLARLLETGA